MPGQEYSLNLGLDVLPISTDKDNLPDISRLYNAVKNTARALDTYTGAIPVQQEDREAVGINTLKLQNICKMMVKTTVAVEAGMIVAVEWSGTEFLCHPRIPPEPSLLGNVFVLEDVAVGEYAEVYLKGLNYGCSGLAIGSTPVVYDTYPGIIMTTPPGSFVDSLLIAGTVLSSNAVWMAQ